MDLEASLDMRFDPAEDRLHPIADAAAQAFARGRGEIGQDVARELSRLLTEMSDDPALGPAVVSLVKLAAYLDQQHGAKAAATTLLQVASGAAYALDQQNRRLKEKREDVERDRRRQARRLLGKN